MNMKRLKNWCAARVRSWVENVNQAALRMILGAQSEPEIRAAIEWEKEHWR